MSLTPEEHYLLQKLSQGIQPSNTPVKGERMTNAELLLALKRRGLVEQGYYVTQKGLRTLRG